MRPLSVPSTSSIFKHQVAGALLFAPWCAVAASQTNNLSAPSLYLVGDLAAAQPSLGSLFDLAHLQFVVSPASGQTTRAYLNSGAWDRLLTGLRPGDFLLIEFGPPHVPTEENAVRTLPGIGDATFQYLDPVTKKVEQVHSFGWYLRRMVVDVISHGASPILCSPASSPQGSAPAPTSAEPAAGDWTRAIATEQRIPFVDLTRSGAALTPESLRAGLETLHPDPLQPFLKQSTGR